MKKLLVKLKSWFGNRSDRLTFDDISLTGSMFIEAKRWWSIIQKCFWNVVQAMYNIRAFFNTLRKAFAE